jgi:four helix bundle protein
MAPNVEDMLVYKKADRAFQAICTLIERTDIRKNFKLRDQLQDAAASIKRNISEGGGQQTDRMLIKYLYYSYGSAKEVRSELAEALALKYISQAELSFHDGMYDEIMAMLVGWIKYLRQSDKKDRLVGGHASKKNPADPPPDSR